MIESRDVSVVLQGPVRPETLTALQRIHVLLPESEVILSTWEDEDVSSLRHHVDEIVQSPCPPAFVQHDRLGVKNNLNRLIRSSRRGVERASRPYILKMRSDMVLEGTGFLPVFDSFQAPGPLKVLKRRVVVPALFSRTGYHGASAPFHLSDWAAFGLAEDVREIFLPLEEVPEPEFTRWFDRPGVESPFGSTLFRLAPEQYVIESLYARRFGTHPMKDARDNGPDVVSLSERFTVSNFIVAEFRDTGFTLPKYPESFDETMIGAEFFELWNKFTYEKAYQRNCDASYRITATKEAELYRRRPTVQAELRFQKHLRRLLHPDSPGKFMGELVSVPVVGLKLFFARLKART